MRATSDQEHYFELLHETPFPDACMACQQVFNSLDLVRYICDYLVL